MRVAVLEDITVVECATYVTGPYATALLADLGARVIKIESPPAGDPYRHFAPGPHFSANFAHLNRNKESIALDLKSEEGKRVCIDLASRADVFVENFRPGVADRLGLGYEALSALNPRLVYGSISAFGQSGPYAKKPGFDTLGQAMSGLMGLLTDPLDPKIPGIALSDYVTGFSAGYGLLGALVARQKSGRGCKVETSLLQATLSFIGEAAATYYQTGAVPNRVDRVRNGHAFAVVAEDNLPLAIHCSVPEKFWLALLEAIERTDLAEDPRFRTRDQRRKNFELLEQEIAAVFSTRTRAEWLRRLEAHDVPSSPLYTIGEVLEDPQVVHLGVAEEVEHPVAGKARYVGPAFRYHGLEAAASEPPPLVGEHTERILLELGYDPAAVMKLKGAVQAAP
ncbi:MAG: CoA transferase [Acidobacteriota bacterium]|jgi:crotonobetainyl-CoA:carnitine CoA-transferase CaiB-like acyl-CoA transferase|nr:CoA transferase [Acidobacteriota bacterium]